MAALKFNQEIKVKVPAKLMFKALVTETVYLLPKAIPNVVKSIDILEGVGIGVGTVYQINLAQGHMKHKIDELDVEKCTFKYTSTEGDMLGDKIESVQCEQKYEDTADGGCVIQIEREIRVKEGVEINEEEEIKDGEESALTTIFAAVEGCILAFAYPDRYWP